MDASTPSRLVLLGQAYLPGEPFEMYLRGDLLVVMTNGAYSVEGQVNEHASSSSMGSRTSEGDAWDRTTGAGVIVLDVKDPARMQRVAAFPVAGEIADSRVVGDILYLATYDSGQCYHCLRPRTVVTTFDIATPASMRQVDELVFESAAVGAWAPDDFKRSVVVTPERMDVGGHDERGPGAFGSVAEGRATEGVVDVIDITDRTGKLVKGAHVATIGAITSRWQMNEDGGVLRAVSQRGSWTTNGTGWPEVQTFYVWNAGSLQEMGRTSIVLPRQEAVEL